MSAPKEITVEPWQVASEVLAMLRKKYGDEYNCHEAFDGLLLAIYGLSGPRYGAEWLAASLPTHCGCCCP